MMERFTALGGHSGKARGAHVYGRSMRVVGYPGKIRVTIQALIFCG